MTAMGLVKDAPKRHSVRGIIRILEVSHRSPAASVARITCTSRSTEMVLKLNEDYRVRTANQTDVPRIAEIWLEGIAKAFANSDKEIPPIENIHMQLSKLVGQQTDDFKFWLCEDQSNSIIGWSTVQPFHTTPLESVRNAFGFISTYLTSSCQGRGVGTLLVRFVLDYCKDYTSVAYVIGVQDRANPASVKITDKFGFLDLGTLPKVEGIGACSIIVATTREQLG